MNQSILFISALLWINSGNCCDDTIVTTPKPSKCGNMVANNRPCGTRFFTQNVQNTPQISRIVGGTKAIRGAYPYQIALYRKIRFSKTELFECGGTIIDAFTVITAAHCINYYLPFLPTTPIRVADYSIVAGGHNLRNVSDCAEQKIDVSRVIVHEKYDDKSLENDIAILELSRSLIFDKFVQPACLPEKDYNYPVGEKVLISGWGDLSASVTDRPDILNVAFVPLITSEDCSNRYKTLYDTDTNIITKDMVCAGFARGGVSACHGDSGGPMVSGSMDATSGMTLVGIASWGKECASPGVPGVYTRVTHFLDWINLKGGVCSTYFPEYPCVNGYRHGCEDGYCWSQCDLAGIRQYNWCYTRPKNGKWQTCKTNEDCSRKLAFKTTCGGPCSVG